MTPNMILALAGAAALGVELTAENIEEATRAGDRAARVVAPHVAAQALQDAAKAFTGNDTASRQIRAHLDRLAAGHRYRKEARA